jgi:hypothetical protein
MTQAELDEHWLPHIEFLIGLGRITAKTIDGKEGWIVPSQRSGVSCTATRGEPDRGSVEHSTLVSCHLERIFNPPATEILDL